MSAVERFMQYAAAFEEAFENDDWSVVEPFFTEDAVYDIQAAPPFGGRHEGRDAVLGFFRSVLDQFDRRFDARELELLEGPLERDGAVFLRWRARYRLGEIPPLVMEGEERAWFAGDRIHLLEDRISAEMTERANRFLAKHGNELRAGS